VGEGKRENGASERPKSYLSIGLAGLAACSRSADVHMRPLANFIWPHNAVKSNPLDGNPVRVCMPVGTATVANNDDGNRAFYVFLHGATQVA